MGGSSRRDGDGNRSLDLNVSSVCGVQGSSARSFWSRAITRGDAISGVARDGRIFPARWRWESIFRSECLERLRRAGLERAIILVACDNPRGRDFWRRTGWEDLPGAMAMGIDL